jgi:geranylgeranyl diphosphate synthase type II
MEKLKHLIEAKLDVYISINNESDVQQGELLKHIFEGGKRLRPMICLAIGQNFNQYGNEILEIGMAIEMIHNASLIIDDMPCMDNDEYRRGILTVHAKYGQDVAIQTALKLVFNALNKIYTSIGSLPNRMKKLSDANRIIYQNIGREGLPLGQYIDLGFLKNPRFSIQNQKNLIFKKTTTLFNMSFLLSYIVFEEDANKIAMMEKASKWFGLAFQLYDDFLDITQDASANTPNFINQIGKTEAHELFTKCITKCSNYLRHLGLKMDFFDELFFKLTSGVNSVMTPAV